MGWIETAGIVIASGTAIWGIVGWRKQMIAERKIGLAEEVLSAFYQAKDIIEAARNPFSSGREGSSWRDEIDDVGDHPNLGQIDAYYAPAERLNKHAEFFSRFIVLQYRSQSVFGIQAREHFAAIFEVLNRVKTSSVLLAQRHYEALKRDVKPMDPKLQNSMRSDIWWSPGDGKIAADANSQKVAAAVEGIEIICRPPLDDSLSLWPWKWPPDFRFRK